MRLGIAPRASGPEQSLSSERVTRSKSRRPAGFGNILAHVRACRLAGQALHWGGDDRNPVDRFAGAGTVLSESSIGP